MSEMPIMDNSYATWGLERGKVLWLDIYAAPHLWGHKLLLLLKSFLNCFATSSLLFLLRCITFQLHFKMSLSTETKIQVTVRHTSFKIFGKGKKNLQYKAKAIFVLNYASDIIDGDQTDNFLGRFWWKCLLACWYQNSCRRERRSLWLTRWRGGTGGWRRWLRPWWCARRGRWRASPTRAW